ncbi:unnamed protein product [Enterobius vermicularis]|uniref:ATP synthase subunit e, mitochondrial n=1 Tax=Enterobius vermicularis TaxID=51028 RepID=A0A0N4VA36_ENTVE|nr:unnamed protein product [Enterobius vermicularis]
MLSRLILGSANTLRAVIITYIGLYFVYKWGSKKRRAALEAAKKREQENIVRDAMARSGLL